MSAFCLAAGVRLLAYGTLGGGFLTDRWVGAPEPTSIEDWSKSKYKRFIDTIGGWSALQTILGGLARGCSQARRVRRQRRHALGARAAGRCGCHRRRSAGRARASGRQCSSVFVLAGRRGQTADRRRLWFLLGASPAIAATSTVARLFLRRPAISAITSRAFRRCSRQSRSMGALTAYASTPAASGSPSAGTAVQCGLAIASLSAEPRPPTAQVKSSVRAMPKGRRSTSWTRSQRASPLWAERLQTLSERVSISAMQTTGSRFPGCMVDTSEP